MEEDKAQICWVKCHECITMSICFQIATIVNLYFKLERSQHLQIYTVFVVVF